MYPTLEDLRPSFNTATPLPAFTPDELARALSSMEDVPPERRCILLPKSFVEILVNDADDNIWADWFDPVTKFETLTTGRVGTLLGSPVFTDGVVESNDCFIKHPCVMRAP